MNPQKVTIYHSPDADDAFMFYGLTKGHVTYPGFEFHHELCDIETLNQRVLRAELECTAASVHALTHLGDKYAVLESGASMGEKNYGPRIVARTSAKLVDGQAYKVALPGELTSATLATKLYFAEHSMKGEFINMNFNEVQHAVNAGTVDCGVIIHEGQITYEKDNLEVILDLGSWWWEKHQLPLPLGVNIVRKDIGTEAIKAAGVSIRKSIEFGLAHRADALEYALSFGRGLTDQEADTFVGMYVNDRTVDIGDEGKRSIRLFLELGKQKGFVPEFAELEFINCASN